MTLVVPYRDAVPSMNRARVLKVLVDANKA